MKRKLFFFAAALLSLGVSAQTAAKAPAMITAAAGQVWWGTTTGSTSSIKSVGISESGVTGNFDFAVSFPGDHFFLEGKKLCAVRVYIPNISTADMGEKVKVWVSKKLPNNVDNADVYCGEFDYSSLSKGRFNDIALPEPYTITSEGYYVGLSFNIAGLTSTGAQSPIAIINPVSNPKSFLRVSGTIPNWYDYSADISFPMMCLFGGEFPDNAACAVSVANVKSLTNATNTRTSFRLENNSPKGVTSIGYTVTDIDGNVSEEKTVKFSVAFRPMGQNSLNIVLPPSSHAGAFHPQVTITKVNGNDNFINDATATADGFQIVLDQSAEKRVVEEEFTGTWCGWCPRGMVGLELAEKEFGDKFIGIAVHYGDIMDMSSSSGYNAVLSNNERGYPSCILDRNYGYSCDPYTGSSGSAFGIKSDINSFLKNITEAEIYVHPTWTTDSKTAIEISSYVYFKMDSYDSAPYAIGYVLTSDSLTGKTSQWAQKNNYAGQSSSDTNLSQFTSGKNPMPGLYFNHVAIAGQGVEKGIAGSIKLPIRANELQRHTITMSLPSSSTLIQNKKNLHVVALLFDTATGQILNAAKSEIFDMATGIDSPEAKTACEREVARYNMQGQRLFAPITGVNIVKYADGHTEKVLVK